ncbi:Ion transport protein-domain-containing protein, partial [Entophlyctis helioformis]
FWWTVGEHWFIFQAVSIVNQLCLIIYYLDILLKWIDDFSAFWKEEWNIADLCIDIIITIPEVVSWLNIYPHFSDQNAALTAMRVIAAFKLVMQFETFKIIIVTIIEAINSMAFLMLFVFMFTVAYAIIGTTLYEEYSRSSMKGLVYQDYFNNVKATLVTLFQLITLDQWDVIDKNMLKAVNPVLSEIYIILWVFLGAFIFRNIFVGVMVHHFDRISDTLKTEKATQVKQKRLERMRKRLKNELAVHGNIQALSDQKALSREEVASIRSNQTGHDNDRHLELLKSMQRLMIASHDVSLGWDMTVQETLASLAIDQRDETLWPRDLLFKYLQLMETLMENMKEYQELSQLASKQLMEMFDT